MTAIALIVGRENDMKLCLIAVFASLTCGLAMAAPPLPTATGRGASSQSNGEAYWPRPARK